MQITVPNKDCADINTFAIATGYNNTMDLDRSHLGDSGIYNTAVESTTLQWNLQLCSGIYKAVQFPLLNVQGPDPLIDCGYDRLAYEL